MIEEMGETIRQVSDSCQNLQTLCFEKYPLGAITTINECSRKGHTAQMNGNKGLESMEVSNVKSLRLIVF